MITLGGEPVGRVKSERIMVSVDPAELQRLDEFASRNRLRSRASAVRALVRIGLEAFEKAEGRTEGGAQG